MSSSGLLDDDIILSLMIVISVTACSPRTIFSMAGDNVL